MTSCNATDEWYIVIDRENECAICYEHLHGEHLRPCLHPVHHDCFRKTSKNICPMCRQVVVFPIIHHQQHTIVDLHMFALIVIVLVTVFYFVKSKTFTR